jgi:hypothetical protein
MRKSLLTVVVVLGAAEGLLAGQAPPGVLEVLQPWQGKSTYLRVDLIRVQYLAGGKDATNVLPDGHVRYRLKMGFRASESTSTDEFTKDIQRSLDKGSAQVRVVGKGSKVTISSIQAHDDEVELEVRDAGGSKNVVRFKYDKDRASYTPDNVKKLLAVCFADTESEAKADRPTAAIGLGMTIDEVIAIKGAPQTRADLGPKIILTYPDLKLIFADGKLADVQ